MPATLGDEKKTELKLDDGDWSRKIKNVPIFHIEI